MGGGLNTLIIEEENLRKILLVRAFPNPVSSLEGSAKILSGNRGPEISLRIEV